MSGPNLNNRDTDTDDIQRFAELGRLSASLLHEISNPLSVALLHLDEFGDQTSESIKHVRRNLIRLTHYVNAARGQLASSSNNKSFYVSKQISDIKFLTRPVARSSYVSLKISKPPHIQIKGDRLQFQQILINLIINAVEAYPKSDLLDKTRVVNVEFECDANYLVIRVKDNGPGIKGSELNKIFEPFYSTKAKQGLGLGLAIVKSYVEKGFKGTIVVSENEDGACFSIKLPVL